MQKKTDRNPPLSASGRDPDQEVQPTLLLSHRSPSEMPEVKAMTSRSDATAAGGFLQLPGWSFPSAHTPGSINHTKCGSAEVGRNPTLHPWLGKSKVSSFPPLRTLHEGSLIHHEGSLILLLSELARAKTFCTVLQNPPGNPTPAFLQSCLYWPPSQASEARQTLQQISSDIS